uniref:Uncharacterized protein n=1 Tax=Anguilla anguilla TaxID=7936 RepID=A0A0E9RNN4_ANGAN
MISFFLQLLLNTSQFWICRLLNSI